MGAPKCKKACPMASWYSDHQEGAMSKAAGCGLPPPPVSLRQVEGRHDEQGVSRFTQGVGS